MKLTVMGVKRIGGTSKAGSQFDMCRLFAMVPIETASNEKITVQGAGFELAEIMLAPEALGRFLDLKFPVSLDLTTDTKPYRGKLEPIVTGFAVSAARAAA